MNKNGDYASKYNISICTLNEGAENEIVDKFNRCADKQELSRILGVSVRTIEKESFRIVGRRKIGKSVRFYLPEIYRALELGKPVFVSKKGSTK